MVFTGNMSVVCIHLHVLSKFISINEGMEIIRHEKWPRCHENRKLTIAEMRVRITTELTPFCSHILRHINVTMLQEKSPGVLNFTSVDLTL